LGLSPDQLKVLVVNTHHLEEHVHTTVTAGPDHKYRIAFTPASSGQYMISPLLENSPLLDPGLPVSVYGDMHGAHCFITDIPEFIRTPSVSFRLVIRDATHIEIPEPQDHEHFHIQALPLIDGLPSLEKAETLNLHYTNGHHMVTWNPHLSSQYHLVVKHKDLMFGDCPKKVAVNHKPARGKNSIMYSEKYTMVSARVEVFSNETERKYVGGDKVDIHVKFMGDGTEYPYVVTDHGDGTYTISWKHQPGKSGQFQIASFVDGEETKNSPQYFNYAD